MVTEVTESPAPELNSTLVEPVANKPLDSWYWADKNCLPWARDYFSRKLVGLRCEDNGARVFVNQVATVEGDVDINKRKGKLFTIYDVNIKLYWMGTDANRKEATGTIKITDFMHDTGIDDVTFEVTLDTDSKASQTIRDVVRKSLGALIRDALRNFSKDLLESNGKLSREEAKTTPKAPLVEKSRATTTVVKTTEVVGEVTSIFHKVMFNTTPQKMYFALLDKKLVSYWSHSDADIGMLPGSNYSLFNGNVTGKIVSLTACKRIEMTWRLKSWLEGHYSDVIMYFDDLGDGKMQLVLSQKNVPVAEKEITEKNWDTFYWAPIKQAYHY